MSKNISLPVSKARRKARMFRKFVPQHVPEGGWGRAHSIWAKFSAHLGQRKALLMQCPSVSEEAAAIQAIREWEALSLWAKRIIRQLRECRRCHELVYPKSFLQHTCGF